MSKMKHTHKKNSSNKNIFLEPLLSMFLLPQWARAKSHILSRLSNTSRYFSVSAVDTVEPAQTLTLPNSHKYLPSVSSAVKAKQVSIVETFVAYSCVPEMQDLPSLHGDWVHSLCSYTERYLFLFLSCTAPGAQVWFWPNLFVCLTLKYLFLAQMRGNE